MSEYRLDDWGLIPYRAKEFSSSLFVQTSTDAHPASCPMGTRGPFLRVKRRWGVTLTLTHI
jgi:hypothetical protein